jgi:hypothetical protein
MNQTTTQTATHQSNEPDGFTKGQLFEQYIIDLFNKHYFYLKQWRKSEKYGTSFLPIDHKYPDLELIFSGEKKYRFAVECKWRKEFRDGKIFWATDNQICTYRKFQDQVRIPVFVAIGIGGKPDSPEKIFLTPLNSIQQYNELYESNLIPFNRKPTRKFYYDVRQLRLF